MAEAFEVPLSSEPQTFSIALAGTLYRCTLRWVRYAEHWALDFELPDGTPVLYALPLLPGVDLLAQHKYLGIGGKMFVQSSDDTRKAPGFEDLGVRSFLFFVSE